MISDNLNALSHTQGSSDRIAELEAKYESLMQAFVDQQQALVDQQQAFVDLKQDVSK